MNRLQVAEMMARTFTRLDKLREAGQKEYAHKDDNAFRNFEDTGKDVNVDRKAVLWIFMKKHLDGIVAHINGHRSQRESVHGRIDDAHVYLELLRGMIVDEGEPETIPGGCPHYWTDANRRWLCKLKEGHALEHQFDLPRDVAGTTLG